MSYYRRPNNSNYILLWFMWMMLILWLLSSCNIEPPKYERPLSIEESLRVHTVDTVVIMTLDAVRHTFVLEGEWESVKQTHMKMKEAMYDETTETLNSKKFCRLYTIPTGMRSVTYLGNELDEQK